MKPVIGLSTALERARWGPWDAAAHVLARSYSDQVQAAGGIAVLLPPDPSASEDPEPWLDLLDGLIITGGADVDPGAYGAERRIRRPRARCPSATRSRSRLRAPRWTPICRCSASAAACR